MGWSSASDIIDPQIPLMNKLVENGELDEANAIAILSTLIEKLQDGDWDCEDLTLEQFLHLPWVVKAFAARGVTPVADGETPTRSQVETAVRTIVDSFDEPDSFDLSEEWIRARLTTKVTDAIAALLSLGE